MLGLQGKSTKPTPREPYSKLGNSSKARPCSGMAAVGSGSRTSRVVSSGPSAPEKPEKLARGPSSSPYSSKMSTGIGNPNRRVQSAATLRHKNSLGPTVKASELFRKNSEPQFANSSGKRGPTNNGNLRLEQEPTKGNKSVKHVRIEGARPAASSLNSNLSSKFDYPHDGSGDATQRRRPFSFSSDRSRSVSVTSNESCSATEHESTVTSAGESPRPGWRQDGCRQDVVNNNNNGNENSPSNIPPRFPLHPRLNKRAYSVDTAILDPSHDEDFHSQMIEMKIAEHPDEVLKEENLFRSRKSSLASARSGSGESRRKSELNRTFTEEPSENMVIFEDVKMEEPRRAPDFDRLLLMHSDSILQDVSDLIHEIKSGDSKKLIKAGKLNLSSATTNSTRAESVEKLVAELRKDNENKSSAFSGTDTAGHRDQQEKIMMASTLAERFNFNNMDISGIELSDITCPQDVMEQSVPNSSRLDRSLTESFLGTNSILFASPSSQYDTENGNFVFTKSSGTQRHDAGSESSDSNNHPFSSASDALSTIQQLNSESSAMGGDASSTSPHSHTAFDIDQEEIQKKICSALKLLEDEDRKVRNRNRSGDFLPSGTSVRSQSPFLPMSNPDSRAESRNCTVDSCKSSPRVRVEERNIPSSYTNESHPRRYLQEISCSRGDCDPSSGFRSARSCSCLMEGKSSESLNSARSAKTASGQVQGHESSRPRQSRIPRPGSGGNDDGWEAKDNKTKQIFSFLDQVEKTDQEILFGLRFETDGLGRPKATNPLGMGGSGVTSILKDGLSSSDQKSAHDKSSQFRTMDCLIRKGSVELAREILLLERKLDEAQHGVKLLEESLLNQRELNIRNLRNSERDFKKRMKLQKDEFDMAFSRNEALINEMASEKRALQDKLDKLIKNFEEMDEKHKEQVKSIQQKHLDEIRRLRKMQQNAENSLKQKIAGSKAHASEIKEMTVKGLEPEVQRIIQRHQQEMSEMRAWHADEVREIEERYQRKLHMQLEDLREKFAKEKEDLTIRERELANRRLDAELKQRDEEIEALKRKHANDLFEERERAVSEEMRLKEQMQESVRKVQIKGEVELENLKQECEAKLGGLDRRHESELKSVKDVFEAERQNWASNQMKKLEQSLADQEARLRDAFNQEKEKEWREKEKKIREDFEKHRKDDESSAENRFRRMQDKFQSELEEMERSEKDVKSKFSQAKSDLLSREEEVYGLKTTLSMKEKQLADLQEMNMKMQEERINLTSVIRREFADQIQAIEEECRSLKACIVEVQANSKLQIEQKQLEVEKMVSEKDAEIEQIGLRVKQTLSRKDETILELQKQLEKCSFQINHLEELLEEQRKEFLHSMKVPGGGGGNGPRKK